MLVNGATLTSVFRGFKVVFNQAFQAAKPNWQKIATLVPSSTKEEEYKWLGKFPRMKEWIGERAVQSLAAFGFKIKNKSFEATVAVDKDDIEDDTIGVYTPMVQGLGESAAMHPDEIVFALLPAGFTETCYDGQYYFDYDHKDGDGPIQSNRSDKALGIDSYGEARATTMSLTDESGRPLGVIPNLLVVPPQLEGIGRKILMAETINSETNVYKGSAELHIEPMLAAYPKMWFLMDTTKPVKPIIYQQRKKPEFVALDNPEDANVFYKKEFVYGVDCRDNAGYGLWQLCYGSTGTNND